MEYYLSIWTHREDKCLHRIVVSPFTPDQQAQPPMTFHLTHVLAVQGWEQDGLKFWKALHPYRTVSPLNYRIELSELMGLIHRVLSSQPWYPPSSESYQDPNTQSLLWKGSWYTLSSKPENDRGPLGIRDNVPC